MFLSLSAASSCSFFQAESKFNNIWVDIEVSYYWSLKLDKMHWPIPRPSSLLAWFEWVVVHASPLTSWCYPLQHQWKNQNTGAKRQSFSPAVSSSPLVGNSREVNEQWHDFECSVAWLGPLAFGEQISRGGQQLLLSLLQPLTLGRRNTVLTVILDWQLVGSMGPQQDLVGTSVLLCFLWQMDASTSAVLDFSPLAMLSIWLKKC